MSWKTIQFALLAGLNEYLPLVGVCVPGPCPAAPLASEIVWWHLVTGMLLLGALAHTWVDVHGWPENRAYSKHRREGPDPPPIFF